MLCLRLELCDYISGTRVAIRQSNLGIERRPISVKKKSPDGLTLYEALLSYPLPIFTVMLSGPSFVENYFVYESQCVNVLNLNELSVFLVLMLMLMSTQFSLAYTCPCAYALMKTRLKKKRALNLAN